MVFVFLYCEKKQISYLEYPVFDAMWQIYIYIKKNVFMHTANALRYFEFPLLKKTNIQSLKENVF
jgi:hypothetical protein